mgnify:CR=1 FL=1
MSDNATITTPDDLLRGLRLTKVADDTWQGPGLVMPRATWVFGGIVAAQTLVAATEATPDRIPRSITTRFLRQAQPHSPIRHTVTPIADTRTFADREIDVRADGVQIADARVMLHVPDDTDLGHHHEMPDVPAPDESQAFAGAGFDTIDLNDPPAHSRKVALPVQRHWMRAGGTPRDDQLVNAAMLLMASDLFLVASAWRPVGGHSIVQIGEVMSFGLNLTMWFHEPFEITDWHLIDVDTPAAANGRSLTLGNWFDQGGRLVASVALDAVMRVRR